MKKKPSKIYSVTVANNGFIIKCEHLPLAFLEKNLRVAKSLSEVMRIIKKDMNV